MKKQMMGLLTLIILVGASTAVAERKVIRKKVTIHTKKGYDTAKKTVYASSNDVVPNLSAIMETEPMSTIGQAGPQGQAATENNVRFQRVLHSSDPSRFRSIQVDTATASNEVNFWSRQMSEHALFNYLGLEDPDLKQEALNLHLTLEEFRAKFNKNPNNMQHMNTVLPLLQQEREFQIKVLRKLDEGKWIGWIFPLFVNHITLELDYFVDKLNGIQYSADEEIMFWNRINSEHAAFAAHLLDPSELDLFTKANAMAEKFYQTPKSEKEMMIRLSLTASKELDAFNKTARSQGKMVKSVIHPVLLDHVIREGERSIQTLQSLGLYKESAQFEAQYRNQIEDYEEPMDFEMEME